MSKPRTSAHEPGLGVTHILEEAEIGTDCIIGGHCYTEGSVRVGDRVTVKDANALAAKAGGVRLLLQFGHDLPHAVTLRRPHHSSTRRDWSRLSAAWTSRIDDRIAELERLKLGLTECIGCGCLLLDRCRLANPGDRAAALGPGPRYWIGDRPPRRHANVQ